jgi:hypothetical protein
MRRGWSVRHCTYCYDGGGGGVREVCCYEGSEAVPARTSGKGWLVAR